MKHKTLEESIQRVEDIHTIQNLMGKYFYLHAAGMAREQMKLFAQKTPGVTVEIADWGVWEGLKGVQKMFAVVKDFERMHGVGMKDSFPHMEIQNDRTGMMLESTLTTPVIEVAGDGKTAKGLWISPGHQTIFSSLLGRLEANWVYAKVGVDFVKEEGEWKIWHYHVYPTFRTSYERSWVESSMTPSTPMPQDFLPEADKPSTCPPTDYNPEGVRQYEPRPPEPYETFSETFSY